MSKLYGGVRWAVVASLLCAVACGGGGGGGAPPPVPTEGFRVLEIDPVDGEIFVPIDVTIVVTFSDPIIDSTIHAGNFLLSERASGRRIPGTVTVARDHQSATLKPDSNLLLNTGYLIRILPDVTSFGGASLPNEHRTYFTSALSTEPPPPPPPPPPRGKFTPLSPMTVGRSSHSATALGTGKVLIAGGFYTSSQVTSTAERFDPLTETFTRTGGNMVLGRGFHTATKLTNSEVLIVGGLAGGGLVETNQAELYDPNNDRFYSITNYMVNPRAFHSATLLIDGRVLVTGGTVPQASGTFSSKTAELYVPGTTGAPYFQALPDMKVYRAGHTATRLSDGKVVIIGGNSTDKRVEIYDPVTDSFFLRQGEMKAARRGHTATLLPDGNILVMGGGERSAEIYFVTKDYFLWASTYPLYERRDHTADYTSEGLILFAGGSYGTIGDPVKPLFFNRTTEIYDTGLAEFFSGSPLLSEPRSRHRSVTLPDGRILFTGGANVDPTKPELSSTEIYSAK